MKYFTFKELGAEYASPKIKNALELLVDKVLDPLRERFGKPIRVNSGYRSPEDNKASGGSKNSQHLIGEAVDITAYDKSENVVLWNLIIEMGLYDQIIWEKGDDNSPRWVHLSYCDEPRMQRKRTKDGIHYYDI